MIPATAWAFRAYALGLVGMVRRVGCRFSGKRMVLNRGASLPCRGSVRLCDVTMSAPLFDSLTVSPLPRPIQGVLRGNASPALAFF